MSNQGITELPIFAKNHDLKKRIKKKNKKIKRIEGLQTGSWFKYWFHYWSWTEASINLNNWTVQHKCKAQWISIHQIIWWQLISEYEVIIRNRFGLFSLVFFWFVFLNGSNLLWRISCPFQMNSQWNGREWHGTANRKTGKAAVNLDYQTCY